ncbi:MAG: alpha/beta fold hydrolase [Gammaproteobacteria bacterium]|nr:alpha/beta fold hydrolase [Gammaproteobacteria bacterium]
MKPVRTVMQILLTVVGAYLGACALLWAFQERLIFYPRSIGHPPPNPPAAPIEIARPDAVLRGWVVNAASDGPLIVYFGGNAEEVSRNTRNWSRRAATTVLVNYRGYGNSTGKPGEAVLCADAVAISEWARARFPDRPLVLFGQSLGSGIAVLAAAAVRPDALILISPYRSIQHVAQRVLPFVPARMLLRHRFDAETAVADLPRTLVLASPRDEVIGYKENKAMVAAIDAQALQGVELREFELRHTRFFNHPPVWEAVDDFLATVKPRDDNDEQPPVS